MLSRTGKLFGLLALLAAIFVPSTALAAGHHRHHHLTARQIRAIRARLLREIKRHPGMIRNKAWLREASIVHFSLPVTIRLNPAGAPTGNAFDNNATLNLGPTLGTHQIGLNGELHASLTFQDAFSTGEPGDASLTLASDGASLQTTSVPLLTNDNVSAQAPNPNPTSDGCVGTWTGTEDAFGQLASSDVPGADNIGSGAPSQEPGATASDVVLRTGSLTINIANPGSTDPVNGAIVGASGGQANLFGLTPAGDAAPVDVKVNLATNINSIERAVDYASLAAPLPPAFLPATTANVDCRQAWTGYVPNVLSTELVGQLRIAPAITADHNLRIARVMLASAAPSAETVAACLVPDSFYTGNPTNPLAAPGAPGSVNSAPNRPCNDPSDPFIAGGLVNAFTGSPSTNGSEVQVSGTLDVNQLNAEVLIGTL